MSANDPIKSLLGRHGVRYSIVIKDAHGRRLYSELSEERHPFNSCFKLAVLIALLRSHSFDQLTSTTETLEQADMLAGGGVLPFLRLPVRLSLADMAHIMITASDATCTERLIDRLSLPIVQRVVAELAPSSRITHSLSGMLARFWGEHSRSSACDFDAMGGALAETDYTTTEDLTSLFCAAYRARFDDSQKEALLQSILRAPRMVPRTELFAPEDWSLLTKTGSIGHGYFTGDCGVVEYRHTFQGSFAYCTSGWTSNANLIFATLGLLGIEICKILRPDLDVTAPPTLRPNTIALLAGDGRSCD